MKNRIASLVGLGRGMLRATLLLLVGSGVFVACAHPPVKPWERETLSRRAMQFNDGLEGRFNQHMFSSREGADGAYGDVGGGCGCN
ncbi:MAG: DUF4266 domain-containing protein [Deltaproteobacteria bacterium]|nr:DUF4266 domain-containing protein [Deltaproteobacteria bacterium]